MPPLGQHGGTLGLPALVWKGTPAQMLCSAAGVLGRGWSEGHGWVQPPGSCARSGGHVPLHPQMCALVLCCAPGVWQGHFPVAVWALHACAGSICHPEAKLTVRQGGERQNPQGKGFSSEAAVTSPRPRTSSAPQPPPRVRSRAGRAPSHSFVLQQGCSGGNSISVWAEAACGCTCSPTWGFTAFPGGLVGSRAWCCALFHVLSDAQAEKPHWKPSSFGSSAV